MKGYFPLLFDTGNRDVLLLGCGKVGLRRLKKLVACDVFVQVYEPRPSEELRRFLTECKDLTQSLPQMQERELSPAEVGKLAPGTLLFICTDDESSNRALEVAGKAAGCLVNVCDARERCDFQVPAMIFGEDFMLTISSGGKDPAAVKRLRERLEDFLK